MSEPYHLIPKYSRLKTLCSFHNTPLEAEFGGRVFYKGHTYLVLSDKQHQLALINEFASIPFRESEVLYVEEKTNQDEILYLPGIEELLRLIHKKTTFLPSMTPGVQATREVWQLRHPNADPVVAGSLEEGLLDLTIHLLEKE